MFKKIKYTEIIISQMQSLKFQMAKHLFRAVRQTVSQNKNLKTKTTPNIQNCMYEIRTYK